MKKVILSTILITIAYLGFAQSLERDVFASSGNFTKTNSMSISSTLGEVFLTTLSGSSATLTQGFQQPAGSGTDGITNNIFDLDINLSPNPTLGNFTLSFTTNESDT